MKRMVLRQNATRDDVDDAVLRCGWQLTNVLPASAERPRQLIYATRDGRTVYLIDDVRLGVTYLAVTGEGAAELLRSVEGLSILRGEPLTAAQLEGAVDLLALRRGVAVPALSLESPSQEVVEAFERALEHADPQVRAIALTAASYALWPELRAVIERVRDGDSEAALRKTAATVQALYAAGATS
jgi:hypothetical protein